MPKTLATLAKTPGGGHLSLKFVSKGLSKLVRKILRHRALRSEDLCHAELVSASCDATNFDPLTLALSRKGRGNNYRVRSTP